MQADRGAVARGEAHHATGTSIRDAILADILAASRRGGVVVVTGGAGVGKTWLARSALATLAAGDTLTGSGKYGENDAQSALGPVMAAMSQLLAAALDRLYDPQTGIASLADWLGVDLDVLVSAGLAAPGLAGRSELKALADRRGGTTRIVAAAVRLVHWLERFDRPLAMLIDDWWRASAEGRDLIRGLAGATVRQPMLLLLTQRDAAIAADLGEDIVPVRHRLGPMDAAGVAALLAQRLGDPERAALAADLLGGAMPTVPFDILEIADALVEHGAFVRRDGRWHLDTARVASLAYDAAARIGRLSGAGQRLAGALALWGDAAPLAGLRSALPGIDPGELQRRGVAGIDGGRIVFCHDRLRRAALDRIDADAQAALAGAMAERLHPGEAQDEVEIAALHLRRRAGLAAAAPASWRDRFARGALAARGRGDAGAAAAFAEAALGLREREAPADRLADRLILREAVLAAADRDDPATEARARALIATATTPAERCDDYETGTIALRLAEQAEAAWRLACEGLARAGIRPPPARPAVAVAIAALRWRFDRFRRLSLPADADMLPPADAFTGIAIAAAAIAYHRDPRGTAIIGFQASSLADRVALRSAYWQSVNAFLYGILGQRGRAADAGEAALAGFSGQQARRAATLYQAIFFGVHWRRPLKSQRGRFPEVTRIAIAEGDLVMAAYGLRVDIMSGWRTADSLDTLLDQAIAARRGLRALGEASFVDEMESMVAMLRALTGAAPWDPAVWRRDIATRNHVIDLELANLAGDWAETVRRAARLRPVRRDYDLQADSIVLRFHETLARLRCGLHARHADLAWLREAAKRNPGDHRGKLLLIEAELLRRRDARASATLAAYADAVEAAMASDSRLDAGLANACAADAAQALGQPGAAAAYRDAADAIWRRWGVRALRRASDPAGDAGSDALAEAEARAAAAERADATKSRLLMHVGHELRTPLQALQAMLDLERAGGEAIDLGEVRDVLASLRAVVDDLNILDGFAGDRLVGAVRSIDPQRLVRSEVAVWRGSATILLSCIGDCPPIETVPDRIRQILRNLLSNAVKYGGSPIEVTLAVDPLAGGRARVTIAVRDHGPGFAAPVERLFEPFERGAFDGDGRGLGLGLTLSQRIAERLGGGLHAADAPGGGACVTLTFVADAAAAAAACPAGPGAATVLLAEDTALVRRLLSTILARAGHRVVEADSAAAAIAAWRGGGCDLAILDIGLPDASGLDVLAAIRRTPGRPLPLPVILLTAEISGDAERVAKGDRAVRVLRKPASARQLADTIAGLLDHARSPAAAWHAATCDLQPIYDDARRQIVEQARGCIDDAPGARTPAALHRLAGFAAQFGWPATAAAAEGIGAALVAGMAAEAAVADLERAIAEMA